MYYDEFKVREEKVLRFDTWPGTSIDKAIEVAIQTANEKRERVVTEFNGTDVEANPGENSSQVGQRWADHRPAPKDQRGVWMAWDYGSSAYPFATEVEALRFGLEKDMKVSFVRWGDYAG